MNVTTVGIDLAKNVFQVHGIGSHVLVGIEQDGAFAGGNLLRQDLFQDAEHVVDHLRIAHLRYCRLSGSL